MASFPRLPQIPSKVKGSLGYNSRTTPHPGDLTMVGLLPGWSDPGRQTYYAQPQTIARCPFQSRSPRPTVDITRSQGKPQPGLFPALHIRTGLLCPGFFLSREFLICSPHPPQCKLEEAPAGPFPASATLDLSQRAGV